ncbi:fis bacterial regulatory protein hth signature [Lucifera butyrica]|uniref:Fis bacterial regulatory protein hth signature n=1 Tax=Lucifera butyrica TaxID=1351585 RepID=A0A498RFJ5_9FIRM|nr:sigma-54 dependent transcriptional regulator [Lucifera butyrica]VBB08863.1 fis bacterial regulatory protein hth signature [Lucifera butyrica]
MNILLVDDAKTSRTWIAKALIRAGHNVIECNNGEAALEHFMADYFPLVLSDVIMPGMTGLELLKKISASPKKKETDVVLFTAHNQSELAIEALRAGAYDYLLKPINIQELLMIIQRLAKKRGGKEYQPLSVSFINEAGFATEEARQELERCREALAKSAGLYQAGFFSPIMQNIALLAQKYHKDRSVPVLIEGETGTGKELIARMIHNGSTLSEKPFVAINCTAISPQLFESELFGYESGAYTGSLRKGQIGKLDLAHGGTLFLDEIGDMPQDLQVKLLRVIQEKEFYRVGGLQRIKTDIRIICATNADLVRRLKSGAFRPDLYYRLRVGYILLPPLRDRVEDIVPLANLFLKQFSQEKGKRFQSVGAAAAQLLTGYEWPGNVRELRNAMEWVVFMYDDNEVKPGHLGVLGLHSQCNRENALAQVINPWNFVIPQEGFSLDDYVDHIVEQALEMHQGNRAAAARMLGMTRRALCCRLEKIK